MPSASSRAHRIEAGSGGIIKTDRDPLWVWTDDPGGCPVILTEA